MVLAARPVADVAVAVGVDVNAVAALLPVLPVPRVLVAAIVVVNAMAVALAVGGVAHIFVAVKEVGLGAVGLGVEQALLGSTRRRQLLLVPVAAAVLAEEGAVDVAHPRDRLELLADRGAAHLLLEVVELGARALLQGVEGGAAEAGGLLGDLLHLALAGVAQKIARRTISVEAVVARSPQL